MFVYSKILLTKLEMLLKALFTLSGQSLQSDILLLFVKLQLIGLGQQITNTILYSRTITWLSKCFSFALVWIARPSPDTNLQIGSDFCSHAQNLVTQSLLS